jgi:hypothetical protein
MRKLHITACKQYCLAAGATQGIIAYTQNAMDILTSDAVPYNQANISLAVKP